jgi:hypothetical protein
MRIPTLAVHPLRYQQIMSSPDIVCKPPEGMSVDLLSSLGISIVQSPYVPLSETKVVPIRYTKKHPWRKGWPKCRTIEEPILGYWLDSGAEQFNAKWIGTPNIAAFERLAKL